MKKYIVTRHERTTELIAKAIAKRQGIPVPTIIKIGDEYVAEVNIKKPLPIGLEKKCKNKLK